MGEGKDEKKSAPAAEMPTGLQPKEGEIIMGVCHIYASFNDTFVHVTDPSGRETLVKVTGGMKVKADRDEASPYAAMLAAQDVVAKCKELGIGGLHIKMRATVRPCARLPFRPCEDRQRYGDPNPASPRPPPLSLCLYLSPTLAHATLLRLTWPSLPLLCSRQSAHHPSATPPPHTPLLNPT